jgi:hypothetical protein
MARVLLTTQHHKLNGLRSIMIKQGLHSLTRGFATIAAVSALLANNVQAAPISTTQPPEAGRATCDVSDVQITEIRSQADGSSALPYPYPIDATGCLGAFAGNDIVTVGENRGFLNDGMLNNPDMFPDSGAFVTPEDLLDLQGVGTKQDPGWIFVGKINYEEAGNTYTNGTVTNGISSYTFDISDILTLVFSDVDDMRSGTFTYKPPVTNPAALLDILGANKFFDQAAVILKASDQWAIYNFKIAALELPAVVGTEDINFMFSGTFNLAGTFINKGDKTPGLSHVSLWLRDPYGATSTVPTPGTLLSLLLGLGLLVASRKLRATNQQS